MEKNKSIDGLAPRRAKKATSKTTKTTSSAAKIVKPAKKPVKTIQIPVEETPVETTVEAPESKKPVINANEDFLKPTQVFDFDENSGELKAAKEAPAKKSKREKKEKKKKQKKPMSKVRKVIIWIALIIVFLLIGATTWFILWGNDIIAKITGGQGNIFSFFVESYEPLKTDTNGRTNILAFGTSGYNMDGDEGNGTHDGSQLTDSIMVISLNQETGDVAMLSLPRDLKASPTCTSTGKINEVYWCNGGNGQATIEEERVAAEALIAEVGSILGIEFQYYAHLNWRSLISIVDTLGGITITLDEDILDYYYTGAVYEAGVPYTIDGAQAMGLSRARHGTASGDFSRGASQQKILIGIKDKVIEKDFSITKLLSLASTLGDNLRTNFSVEEMKKLASLLSDFDFDNMRQVSLIEPERLMTTGMINGISYVLPSAGIGNYGAIQAYVAKMFSNNPRDYEDYSILVLNATDTSGIATAEQAKLEEDGYKNIYADNAPEGEYSEGYTLYTLTDSAPNTKKLLEEKYGTAKPADELPASIDTECDFVLIINTAE